MAGLRPEPGWYPDVSAPGMVRWWDGRQWTDHRVPQPPPGGAVPPPPPDGSAAAATSATLGGWQAMQQPGAAPSPRGRISGLAIGSLIAGLLWVFGFGSLLGLILGVMALREIRRSAGAVRGRLIAWVGIAVSATTLGLTIWAVAHVDDVADRARQIIVDRSVEAELRAAAVAMEVVMDETGRFPNDVEVLADVGYRPAADIRVRLVRVSLTDYCLDALHDDAATVVHLVRHGEPTQGPCPGS